MKSGKVTNDITGHKVTKKEVPEYYAIADRVRKEANEKRS